MVDSTDFSEYSDQIKQLEDIHLYKIMIDYVTKEYNKGIQEVIYSKDNRDWIAGRVSGLQYFLDLHRKAKSLNEDR